jgi:hypothetical protein
MLYTEPSEVTEPFSVAPVLKKGEPDEQTREEKDICGGVV